MADRDDLRKRSRALRLTNKQIAESTGLDVNTVGRLFAGGNVLLSTVEAVALVVEAEEDLQRARLAGTKPVEVAQ